MSHETLKRLTALLIPLLLFWLVACNSLGASTPVQESITVYTAIEDDQLHGLIALFEKEHPNIKVFLVRESTGAITSRLLAEKAQPRADVVWGIPATSLLVADAEGLLEPYAPAGLERVDPKFRDEANPPHWVGIDVWMSAFCINTEQMEALGLPTPTSWAELTDPIYKNHIIMPNPNSSGTGFLSVAAILQLLGEEEGWAYLDALHENIAQYTHSGSRPCTMAAEGEIPIGISFDYRAISQKLEGDPIQPVFPAEGSGWDMEANALVKKSEIKASAKTFLDWAISDSAMRQYIKAYGITSVRVDVPPLEGFPADPIGQLIENDFEWAATHREEILKRWLRRYDSKSAPRD